MSWLKTCSKKGMKTLWQILSSFEPQTLEIHTPRGFIWIDAWVTLGSFLHLAARYMSDYVYCLLIRFPHHGPGWFSCIMHNIRFFNQSLEITCGNTEQDMREGECVAMGREWNIFISFQTPKQMCVILGFYVLHRETDLATQLGSSLIGRALAH